MTRRNLILIHRGHAERDFREIAEKVHALDRSITVFCVPANLEAAIPDPEWRYPTLTVAMGSDFKLPIKRGPVLKNHQISKLDQQDVLRAHGIPTPSALHFTFGMTLDQSIFGEFVVLKPMDLRLTSHGNLVYLFWRTRLCRLEPDDLPPDHPVRNNPHSFLVQKYIHTGTQPRCIRVGTFLGKAIFCYSIEPKQLLPHLDAPDDVIEQASVASNSGGERIRRLVVEEDAIRLAEAVHKAFGSIPLLGIDILQDHFTGELYVLETNPGGNTWIFSSKLGEGTRTSIGAGRVSGGDADAQGRLALIEQLGAFDVVARGLVAKTRELSS
jgi:hypothetical protein